MAAKRAKAGARSGAKGKNDVPPTRATGAETATGTAIAAAEHDIPKGADRGSKVKPVGGEVKPDADGPQKPRGLQAEPAKFVSNGSLEPNTIASNSGPIPAVAVARDADHAAELVKQADESRTAALKGPRTEKKLSDATVQRLGSAELRAIAEKRGYQIGEAGTRVTRAAFIEAQAKDKNLGKAEEI